MKYIRKYDAKEQTVLMMRVENETGLLGTVRDKGNLALPGEHILRIAEPKRLK